MARRPIASVPLVHDRVLFIVKDVVVFDSQWRDRIELLTSVDNELTPNDPYLTRRFGRQIESRTIRCEVTELGHLTHVERPYLPKGFDQPWRKED